ncbi:MAG: RagB/SusD family nutrient uptake outer membrane protein [Bacteroidaceae bacterium]|nr:RagB/SusD family nutrient uptake outer membrane protein [Bacteroidaceae bacterium]
MMLAAGLTSCNDYLDKLPDDRAEVNTEQKVRDLLVSAYPETTPNLLLELTSDNVDDNGKAYGTTILMEELYRFKEPTDDSFDSPRFVWNDFYGRIATANVALESIENLGNPASLAESKAEAQMVRAYCMFTLANTFCMAYNPEKADQYLGLPYPKKSGVLMNERGTLRQLYENIEQDISEALPNIGDNYSVPKYHFNTKAAYAFAARFYLYYMKYDKAIEYANRVLGSNPANMMRDYKQFLNFGVEDIWNKYVQASESCNLLLSPAASVIARYLGLYSTSNRFRHNSAMASYETYWVNMPWGSGSTNNAIYYSHMLYGSNQLVYFPTINEFFEYSDKVAGIGVPHIVDPVFTAEQTLLVRAEANALTKNYQKAIDDLNVWVKSHCDDGSLYGTLPPTLTETSINEFINGTVDAEGKRTGSIDYAPANPEGNRDRTMRKRFNPQGFTVEMNPIPEVDPTSEEEPEFVLGTTQENILEFVLHMRRLETISHGIRLQDLKRYGIEFTHKLSGEDPITITAGDIRLAIQIPADVISAGMEGNPRPSETLTTDASAAKITTKMNSND